MQIENYLKKHQPIVYQTFKNSLESNHLSHAYLISGEKGTPLLEVATFLGKSIICDDPTPFACNSCITCLRVESDNYPDFFIFDGSKGSIKKELVNQIESQSERTAFESKGIRIYVLNLIENMTVEAINALLKFLEEPGKEIYAFLTTNNESSILPTVISRCQLLRLRTVDRAQIIEEAVLDGVNREDAEFLSYFYNNAELIKETLTNKTSKSDYDNAKKAILDLFDAFNEEDTRKVIYRSQSQIIPLIKNKETLRFFLDILNEIFDDLIKIKMGKEPILQSYATILTSLVDKLPHIESSLIEILKIRNEINLNVNVSLIMDHIMFVLTKE